MHDSRTPRGPTRRWLLRATGVLASAGAVPHGAWPSAASTSTPPTIHPREDWGADTPPVGPLEVERPGDTRFLLVHHTASGNRYTPEEVPGLIRSFYRTHTGPKGWPDVAYNFFVDRHGGIWEGRAGSLEQPVKGSATGGSQGFAQLCCLIGDHEAEPPTIEAERALASLLAGLATRYGIDPEGTTTFVSRGSNRHPAGSTVTTPTITGHREMSQTVCPGRFGVDLVGRLPALVAAATGTSAPQPVPEPAPTAPPAEAAPPAEDTPPAPAAPINRPGTAEPAAPPVAALPVDRPERAVVVAPLASKQLAPLNVEGPRLVAAGLVSVVGTAVASVISRRGLR